MVALLLLSLAQADIPPPKGYVESCTVANHATEGRECVTCEGYYGGREPCEKLEAEGYTKACQTRGASVWTEVMCRAAAAAPVPPPPEPAPAPAPAPAPDPASAPAPAAPPDDSSGCDVTGGPRLDVAPEPPDGCKCATGAMPRAWLPLAALLLLATRRRC